MVGSIVKGRFEIGELIGSGGFGQVYRAWDHRLEREVAVKVVETAPQSDLRIEREAQAAARLNHPGIVMLFEFVYENDGPSGGRAYLVSELVDGRNVRELIDRGLLSDHEIARFGVEVAESLTHAHSRGVVHRDLKPSNLIRPEGGGQTKLMDFGIARLADGDDLTRTGDVLGTLAYMSPEQAEGLEAGPKSDVFSLGLTLFEAFAGENPRRRATTGGTVRALVEEMPTLQAYRPDLPIELVDAIDQCLAMDPGDRPDPTQLGADLGRAGRGLSTRRPDGAVERPGGRPVVIGTLAKALPALMIGSAVAYGLVEAGSADFGSVVLAGLAVGAIAAFIPRLGFLAGSALLIFWLASVVALPGAAVALGLVTIPAALLVAGRGSALAVIPVAPLVGLAGLAPAAPLLAGLAERPLDRVAIALSGLFLTAFAEVATGRELLFGDLPAAGNEWAASPVGFASEMLIPVLITPSFLLAIAVWTAVALIGGWLFRFVRNRGKGSGQVPAARTGVTAAIGSGGVSDVS
jgi:hypothetical protein